MKKLLLTLCLMIIGAIGAVKADAQAITRDQLPMLASEMKKMCPQKAMDNMYMTDVFLKENNTQMWFVFNWDTTSVGVTPGEMIAEFKKMSPAEIRKYVGEDFIQLSQMLPAAMYIRFTFQDGQSYDMKLSR